MKKFFIMMAALLTGVSMSAQLKGDMSIYGNLNISTSSSSVTASSSGITSSIKESEPFKFGIGAGFGVFVADNFEISLGLGYDLSRWQNNQNQDTDKKFYDTQSLFQITPGFKYYVSIVDDVFYYTPGLNFGFGFNSGKTQVDETTTAEIDELPFVFDIGLDLIAFEYKPSYNIGISLSLGGLYYVNESYKFEEGVGETLVKGKYVENSFRFGFDSILTPKIGVKYYFF